MEPWTQHWPGWGPNHEPVAYREDVLCIHPRPPTVIIWDESPLSSYRRGAELKHYLIHFSAKRSADKVNPRNKNVWPRRDINRPSSFGVTQLRVDHFINYLWRNLKLAAWINMISSIRSFLSRHFGFGSLGTKWYQGPKPAYYPYFVWCLWLEVQTRHVSRSATQKFSQIYF